MPSKGWGKGTEILNAVQDCKIRRLSTRESLQYLEAKGFKMGEAKLRRIKKHIRESTQDRLNYIAYHEYATSQIEAIDTVKSVNAILWEVVTGKRKANREELKALEMIPQNLKLLEEFYDSNPVVAALADKLMEKENVSEKGS